MLNAMKKSHGLWKHILLAAALPAVLASVITGAVSLNAERMVLRATLAGGAGGIGFYRPDYDSDWLAIKANKTATVYFTNQGKALSVGLQSLVNKFSGGQP